MHRMGCFFKRILLGAVLSVAIYSVPAMAKESYSYKPMIAFKKNYLSLEVLKNLPVGETTDKFSVGPNQLGIGYKHIFKDEWLMGWGVEFRTFNVKKADTQNNTQQEIESSQLAFLTISHELYYIYRFKHPFYVLAGGRLHWMYPAKKGGFPVKRASEVNTETSAGLSAMMVYTRHDQLHYHVRLERWRGLASMRYHGLEMALGVSWGLE